MCLLSSPAAFPAGRGADGRFEKRESSHFILYQDVDIDESGGFYGSRRFEQQVLGELEGAYDRLDDFLGLRPSRKLEVMVYDPGMFDANFAGLFRFQAAGFYHGVIRVRGATQLTDGLARVLHHELVHAAFDAAAPSLVLPAWMNEGVSEWFEARALGQRHLSRGQLAYLQQAARQRALLPLSALSVPSFSRMGQEAATLAYVQSFGMVAYLSRHFGDAAIREFCVAVVRTGDLHRSMRRTFRMSLADLEAKFISAL